MLRQFLNVIFMTNGGADMGVQIWMCGYGVCTWMSVI